MNAKKMALAIVGTIAKVVVAAVIIALIYKGAVGAYNYGYCIFADVPVAEEPGRDVNVTIPEGKGAKAIGEILESKGLIDDAQIFFFQNLLSSHKDKLKAGDYILNTSMSAEEMMAIMSAEDEIVDEEETAAKEVANEDETADEEETE